MADYDVPSLVLELLLDDFSNIRILPDQLSQGVVNELVLMRLMKGAFSHHPLLVINGRRMIDPSNVHYYGVSLGGIMGEVYMGLTNDVERGESVMNNREREETERERDRYIVIQDCGSLIHCYDFY